MTFRVSGKNIEVGEALRERIATRIEQMVEKFFGGGYSGHVTVGKEAFGFHSECCILIQASCCAATRWKPMPISAPIRPPTMSKSSFAAITRS